jgi:hypothetical protein
LLARYPQLTSESRINIWALTVIDIDHCRTARRKAKGIASISRRVSLSWCTQSQSSSSPIVLPWWPAQVLGRMEGELRASHLLEGSAIAQNVTEFPPPQLDHLWGLLLCHRLPWIRRPRNPVRHSHRRPTPSSKRSRDSTARERCRRWARADDDRRDLERSAKLFKAANFQPE